jgi:hypothetical protein
MRPRLPAIALTLCALAFTGLLAGCGEEEELEVIEGEPVEVNGLAYNVFITRFLNPDDNQDAEYLVGQPPPEAGENYLGVFLTVENEGDERLFSSSRYAVVDSQGSHFEPLESESPYALQLGAPVPAGDELPLDDTTAQAGPSQGALLLFKVPDTVTENRPLELEIETVSATGTVDLDV